MKENSSIIPTLLLFLRYSRCSCPASICLALFLFLYQINKCIYAHTHAQSQYFNSISKHFSNRSNKIHLRLPCDEFHRQPYHLIVNELCYFCEVTGAFSFLNGYSAATATSCSSPKSLRWESGGENQDIFISHFALGPVDFPVSQLVCCTREIKVGVHQTFPRALYFPVAPEKPPFLALTTA